MVARLIATAVALVMTGAPAVTAACQGVCAARASGGLTGEHHSCHHETPATTGTAISSTIHVCGHSDETPNAIGQSLWSVAGPVVSVAIFALLPPAADQRPRRAVRAEHNPSDISPQRTQLRI
jgi:hypothetical protein